jgi:hypothetical protein
MSKQSESLDQATAAKSAQTPAEEPRRRQLNWFRDDDTLALDVRPAPHERAWMNATRDRIAYRCPPLSTANTYGWEILNPVGFYAIWNGGDQRSDVAIYHDKSDGEPLAKSGFGSGTLTFPVRGLVRTEPGFDLYVSGPVNRPKPNIHAMAGIVEADWYWQEFSVSWLFTRPNELVHFEKGEPFCAFFPIQRGLIETFEPRFRRPEDDPAEWQSYRERMHAQRRWNEAVQVQGSSENKQHWHRNYVRGPKELVEPPHRVRTKLKPFKD